MSPAVGRGVQDQTGKGQARDAPACDWVNIGAQAPPCASLAAGTNRWWPSHHPPYCGADGAPCQSADAPTIGLDALPRTLQASDTCANGPTAGCVGSHPLPRAVVCHVEKVRAHHHQRPVAMTTHASKTTSASRILSAYSALWIGRQGRQKGKRRPADLPPRIRHCKRGACCPSRSK